MLSVFMTKNMEDQIFMKKYEPKKKRYNDLGALAREMIDNRVRMVFTGHTIATKNQIFTMLDGEILIRDADK